MQLNLMLSVFAYINPDVVLPLTSVFAAIGGLLLMFGQYTRLFLTKSFRFIFRRKAGGPSESPVLNQPNQE